MSGKRSDALAVVPHSLLDCWQAAPDGPRYIEALAAFLGSFESPHTRRAYAYALEHFYSWYGWKHGCTPTPAYVSRSDAAAYASELQHPSPELVRYRLGDSLAGRLYDLLAATPGLTLLDLTRRTGAAVGDVRRTLVELTRRHIVLHVPDPRSGSPAYYLMPARRPEPVTVLSRLSALSSFWSFLADTGENRPGAPPLLTHNIWERPINRLRVAASSAADTARVTRAPTWDLWAKLVATTYPALPPADALAAAQAAWRGQRLRLAADDGASLLDLRDRALLLALVQLGLRAGELENLRRRDLTRDGLLTVTGKGRRRRVIRVPEPVQVALRDLEEGLRRAANEPQTTTRARTSRRVLEALLGPDGPLFPAPRRWGKTWSADPHRGLTRSAVAAILAKRAALAGFEPGSTESKRCHPHGFRHLAARLAVAAGVPLPTIQAALGHSSLSTTGRYASETDPYRTCLVPDHGTVGHRPHASRAGT